MNELIRALVREEIARILNDDALLHNYDTPGIVDDIDDSGLGDFSSLGDTNIDSDKADKYNHDKKSYMARPQLYRIAKYATDLLNIIKDGEEVDDWIESYIAQSEQMMNSVYGKFDFKNSDYHK